MSGQARFVDTNIFLRYLTADDPIKAERSRQLLNRVDHGDDYLLTSPLVIFEVVFTLQRS